MANVIGDFLNDLESGPPMQAPPPRIGGSRSWRNNNPGNIEYGPFARSMGAIGSDGRFAIFPSYQSGRQAQERLLFDSKGYRNLTIGDAIRRWAPATENNVPAYIAAMGGDADKPMSEYTPEERSRLLDAMQRHEGWKPGIGGGPDNMSRVVNRYDPAAADAERVRREGGPRMVLSPDYPATTGGLPPAQTFAPVQVAPAPQQSRIVGTTPLDGGYSIRDYQRGIEQNGYVDQPVRDDGWRGNERKFGSGVGFTELRAPTGSDIDEERRRRRNAESTNALVNLEGSPGDWTEWI